MDFGLMLIGASLVLALLCEYCFDFIWDVLTSVWKGGDQDGELMLGRKGQEKEKETRP